MNKTAVAKILNNNWKFRHICVVIVAAIGCYALLESRAEWSAMHRWNRALGDMSFLLVVAAMSIGPLSRLFATLKPTLPWRRECGIYGVLLAIVHVVIILAGWVEWDLIRLFGYEFHPQKFAYVMLLHGFGLANVIGIIALLYAILLALISNDLSQKLLGARGWKFLQQGAYVYWMLVVVHTAYFLYLHFQDFHRRVPDPNWAQWPFAIIVLLVLCLQLLAFIKTLNSRGQTGSHRQPLENSLG